MKWKSNAVHKEKFRAYIIYLLHTLINLSNCFCYQIILIHSLFFIRTTFMRTASLRFEILKSISWEIFASIKLIMKKIEKIPRNILNI